MGNAPSKDVKNPRGESKDPLFDFVDTLPWPVIVMRDDGQVVHVTNKVIRKKDIFPIRHSSSLQVLFPEYFAVLRGSKRWLVPQEAELTRQGPQSAIHERIILRRVPSGSYLIVLDETRLHTLEISNVQTARLAALGFMVAGVCHELSNPLASIHSMVQILKSDKNIEPGLMKKGLINISSNVKRLLDVSRRLLNFSRVGDEPRVTFPIDESIEEAFAAVRQECDTQHVDIVFERDPGALVLGNPSHMQEVFVNIFENAIQAMAGAGKIVVNTGRKEGRVVVTIRDTGPGIPKEAMPRLFEPFYTTKPAGRGTGLGLAISNDIMREHEGSIEAANNDDTGACFFLDLPLYKEKS
jgi:two-component system NtrC family sensor kinase